MYRPVFNRSNHLNVQGKVLMQVGTYLDKKKVFSTHIYLMTKQWNRKKCKVVHHLEADSLNYLL